MNIRISALAAIFGWVCAINALAQVPMAGDYPNRPIRLIVPFGPGGVTDITARTVAPLVAEVLQATIVVENRAGGGTIIGTEAVAKAKPDGYTVLLASGGSIAANPVLFRQMPYDATRDLAGVSMVSTLPYVLVVHPTMQVGSAAELIALAKAKPKALSYASAGNGSGNHLTAELFANSTGIEVLHVPYKSGGAMIVDLMAGTVSFAFSGLPAAMSHIKGGKIKALGVTSGVRVGSLPDVPTVAESGAPGFINDEWTGVFVPSGTPAAIIVRLSAALGQVLARPEVAAKLRALGAEASPSTPARLEALLKNDIARWTRLAQVVRFEAQ